MGAPRSRSEILTDEERMEWRERDEAGFWRWFTRMNHLDISEAQGEKVPRHRYNKKNPRMP